MLSMVDKVDVFVGKKKIIKKVSFGIRPGDIVGLIGPNGAGKTTIMKTILGLTRFDGKILINNKTVSENNHSALSKVGALIEHPAIYPFLTGLQNLELYSTDQKDMLKIIHMLKMESYIKQKSKGYSLGMKQKLGIAIALLNNPKLVILDEPLNGLDVEATVCVRKIIRNYAKNGTAFLISSHILDELQKIMTRIILINDGKVLIDQDIKQFNLFSGQKYKLNTETNQTTKSLLKNKFDVSTVDNYLLIKKEDIFNIQDILFKNKIHIIEIAPISMNFEQIIIKLLHKQGE